MNSFNKETNKILIENTLPHNFLAEKLILSCILFNSDVLDLTQKNLVIDAFYFKNHQELYKNILKMNEDGLRIDIVTLTIFLQDNGSIAKIGGVKVLLNLSNQIPSFSYLDEYIRIVKEKFLKRLLIRLGYRIINSGYLTNKSLENSLTEIEEELFYLTSDLNTKNVISTAQILYNLFLELKDKFLHPQLSGISSGFSALDILTQGFQKSDLIIIAGRPSMGKTALSLNLALNCIKISRLPVLFCSLEMSREQILYRLLSSETGINQMKLKSGRLTQNDWIKLNKIIQIIAKLPFLIDDNADLSIQKIRSKIKTSILEQTQIGLVIIDYLQLMQYAELGKGTRAQELSQITRYLKNVAKEFNIPVIALSQLSRNVDNRIDQRPILSDLRESGSIEQDADLILMLSPSKLTQQKDYLIHNNFDESPLVDLIIAKHRNGPVGTIQLLFDKTRLQFLEYKT